MTIQPVVLRPAFTCGFRTVGIYVCERGSLDGSPVEFFMICPPPYVDMEAIGLSATGFRIIERVDWKGNGIGIWDLWDYVGLDDNPWPADFIEQTRQLGTSRKISEAVVASADFKKLEAHPFDPSLSSRHIYVHGRALIEDPEPFYKERSQHARPCPAGIEAHDKNESAWEMCAALWWEAVDLWPDGVKNRYHEVKLPRQKKYRDAQGGASLTYEADYIPRGVAPKFLPGIILSIPLMSIEIPRDQSGENEHDRLAKLLEDGGWQYNYEITED